MRTEQLTKCQKMRVRLGACKTGLSTPPPPPPSIFINDRSKAILLTVVILLFCVLKSIFCAV